MFNITFKNFIHLSLEEKKIVLDWRNSDRIRLKMNDQKIISLENHLNWVDNLNIRKDCVYYFYCINNESIGIFNLTSIDQVKRSCIRGSYIGNTKYPGASIFVHYYSLNLAFEKYNINKVYSNVLKTNERVYKWNKQILNAIDESENEIEYFIYWDKNIWEKQKNNISRRFNNIYVKWID